MTQDVLATVLALGAVAALTARWWRGRRKPQGSCEHCESSQAQPARPLAAPPTDAAKPLTFFGSSGKKS